MDLWKFAECIRLNFLVIGFVRNQYVMKKKLFDPQLIMIMVKSLGNVFMKFDLFPPECDDMIDENGTVVKWTKQSPTELTIGCSYGWNYGLHEIHIECITEYWHYTAFGITSNPHFMSKESAFIMEVKTGCHYGLIMGVVGGMIDGYEDSVPFTFDAYNCDKANKKSIVTIRYNGNEWKVTFLINGKVIGTRDIEPCVTYYPCIGFTYRVQHIGFYDEELTKNVNLAEYRIINNHIM